MTVHENASTNIVHPKSHHAGCAVHLGRLGYGIVPFTLLINVTATPRRNNLHPIRMEMKRVIARVNNAPFVKAMRRVVHFKRSQWRGRAKRDPIQGDAGHCYVEVRGAAVCCDCWIWGSVIASVAGKQGLQVQWSLGFPWLD